MILIHNTFFFFCKCQKGDAFFLFEAIHKRSLSSRRTEGYSNVGQAAGGTEISVGRGGKYQVAMVSNHS